MAGFEGSGILVFVTHLRMRNFVFCDHLAERGLGGTRGSEISGIFGLCGHSEDTDGKGGLLVPLQHTFV